jgi:hypothetical protein
MVRSALCTTPVSTESSGTLAAGRKARSLASADSLSISLSLVRLGASAKTVRVPLTPAAFKAAAYAKGWSLKALADRWGFTAEWLTRLAGNSKRPAYFDDAVRGLPRVGPPRLMPKTWRDQLVGAPAPAGPGFRYRGYLVVGAVVAASKAVGSMADEGMHGIVVNVASDQSQEVYRVVFETGEMESFTPDMVDEYLVGTGLERDELMQYRYVNDERVMQDYREGRFVF